MFEQIKKYLLREKTPYYMNDKERVMPVSSTMGFDRGLPLDRFFIEQFLFENREKIRGKILEVSESTYSRKYHKGGVLFSTLHISPDSGADVIADLSKPETVPEGIADCFICTQTFNFVFDVKKAMESSAKLLSPHGVLLGTVAGFQPVSQFDMDRWGDFWRFTDLSVRRLLSDFFVNIHVKTYGNLPVCKAFADGAAVEDIENKALLKYNDPVFQLLIAFSAEKKQ